MGTTRIIREKRLSPTATAIVERSALGQVADYRAYRLEGDERTYLGGGTKREAQRAFDKVTA